MTVPKIHILYEYGSDFRPHASPYICLLRPLTHPALGDPAPLEITQGHRYEGQAVDAVIVDRLWQPNVKPHMAQELTHTIRQAGARMIYAIDDNLIDLRLERDWPSEEQMEVMFHWLQEADVVWVTTEPLKKRLEEFNPHILVLPNQLDERLLLGGPRQVERSPFEATPRIKIGYMGTLTHNEDLRMVLPALQSVWQRHSSEIEFQFVGVAEQSAIREAFGEIPVRLLYPGQGEQEYPLFQMWFSSHVAWHIALSPLRDSPFTRCKSDIKFLDYCAVGAAGIYSNVTAYQSSVQHGQTGLLVENDPRAWEDAIENLLVTQAYEPIAYQASRYLYQQRTLAQHARDWLDAVHQSL